MATLCNNCGTNVYLSYTGNKLLQERDFLNIYIKGRNYPLKACSVKCAIEIENRFKENG